MPARIQFLLTALILLLTTSLCADAQLRPQVTPNPTKPPAAKPQQGSAPAKGILDVQVFDGGDGRRLRGATVAVPGYRSTTGLGGSCRFSLVPGRYSVLISKDGYRGRRINAGVKPGETTTLRVELQRLTGRAAPKDAPVE